MKQAALGGFGTQRSRPSAGGVGVGGRGGVATLGESQNDWPPNKNTTIILRGIAGRAGLIAAGFLRGLGGSPRRLKGNWAKLFNAIKQKRSFQVV